MSHDPRTDPKTSEPSDHRHNPNESIGVGEVVPDRNSESGPGDEPARTGDMDGPGMEPEDQAVPD
jgi:hypothetical protein